MTCYLNPKQKIRNPNTRLMDGGQVEIFTLLNIQ